MISVAEARERILSVLTPTAAEWVSLAAAAGRVLAQPVIARRTQPPADLSAMDGYALRAADAAEAPIALDLRGESRAGGPPPGTLPRGAAMRIFTGAPLPEGADGIVIQENTEDAGAGRIRILEPAERGRHIRRAGLDFRDGETVLEAGLRLGPRHIALAASADAPWLAMHRRPRVAVLSTGDELVRAGEVTDPMQIVESGGPAIAALAAAHGADVTTPGIARDTDDSLQALVAAARGADLLVTIGGASVGDYDLVRSGLKGSGLELDFWKVAQRPGKPMIFGRIGETPMIGLPGNPVSALVCGLLYVGPAIDVLSGLPPRAPQMVEAVCNDPLPENGGREFYMMARMTDPGPPPRLRLMDTQDSSAQSRLARADALIVRAPQAKALQPGATVLALPLSAAPGL